MQVDNSVSDSPERFSARGLQTRAAILQAAELAFASAGFAATRLGDVADEVGIRRASLVYYFKDKRELYDAVLEDLFAGLSEAIRPALSTPGAMETRVEAAVSAWVDYVGARPSFARLLLREVADAVPGHSPPLLRHTRAFSELVEKVMAESQGDPLLEHPPIHPAHLASTIAGATVFFVAVIPTLVPNLGFDPLGSDQLDAHRGEILRITRRLLGTPEPS